MKLSCVSKFLSIRLTGKKHSITRSEVLNRGGDELENHRRRESRVRTLKHIYTYFSHLKATVSLIFLRISGLEKRCSYSRETAVNGQSETLPYGDTRECCRLDADNKAS